MKRIVVLIDGTWNQEGTANDTNVAKLDIRKIAANSFIKAQANDGTAQRVHYHDGVGTEGDFFKRLLGGAIGLGLKQIIQECYEFIVADYNQADEIYVFGFSRGAYAARALAGLIGASGILQREHAHAFETAWQHYRIAPSIRSRPDSALGADRKTIADYRSLVARQGVHDSRSIACVAVWDTVGSYGIPAGFGLAPLARYFALLTLGFHDTSFGEHIAVGLHAVATDEHRRPFVPTFWTIVKGQQPKGHVEQIWFAGAHCNVGGGYADTGLSDQALIWMIARVQALTGLEFEAPAITENTKPNFEGSVIDSTEGWPLDHYFPHYRKVLSPAAIHHGYVFDTRDSERENINERIHWSMLVKHANNNVPLYRPPNLPTDVLPEKIVAMTDEERLLLQAEPVG